MTPLVPSTAHIIERRLDDVAAARYSEVGRFDFGSMWDPARVPAEWLEILGWALSVDFWPVSGGIGQQRVLVGGFADHHAHKGTEQGIRDVLDAAGAMYRYTETGPWTANLSILNRDSLLTSYEQLVDAVGRAKRASVHLGWFVDAGTCGAVALGVASAVRTSKTIVLTLDAGG